MSLEVTFCEGVFRCRCTYESRDVPREAGFRWDTILKVWFTDKPQVAARLETYLDDVAKNEIAKTRIRIETWTGQLPTPKGKDLLDFQKNAALFALSRNRSYLALDPGLGKTPIAVVITNALRSQRPIAVFYLCPPFLTRNTENEFANWGVSLTISRWWPRIDFSNINIIPDSVVTKDWVRQKIKEAVLFFKERGIDSILFVDEAHRFKNDDAQRTQSLFGFKDKDGIADLFTKIVYLSGTPMPNRPIELYPVLNHSAPETIDRMNKFDYAVKYCAAFKNQWGWDFSGNSNMGELRDKVMGTFMLRYRKSEVMKELPPKIEEMVILNETLTPKLAKISKSILEKYSPEDLMKGQIELDLGKDDLHLSTYRKELGILKAPIASEYIKYCLEESEEKILVFAIHKEVVNLLERDLSYYSPLVVTGSTKMELREAYTQEFQKNKRQRLFIGNIQAAGLGFTLTKATRIIFVEFSWVPADNAQASDRAHRYGQTEDVLVQYLVHPNSVDRTVIETILRKQKVTAHI